MGRKTARLLLSGGILAAVLSGGALALSGGDSLISLRELNEIFLPKAQTQMEERMNSALQSTYDQALAQSQGESGGGGGLYSACLLYTSGVERGLLLALRMDRVQVGEEDRGPMLAALSPTPVSDGGAYRVLVGAE